MTDTYNSSYVPPNVTVRRHQRHMLNPDLGQDEVDMVDTNTNENGTGPVSPLGDHLIGNRAQPGTENDLINTTPSKPELSSFTSVRKLPPPVAVARSSRRSHAEDGSDSGTLDFDTPSLNFLMRNMEVYSDGVSEKFEDWIKAFERMGGSNNWNYQTACKALPGYLRGYAGDVWDNLDPEIQADWKRVRQEMIDRLLPKKMSSVYSGQLHNRNQTESESVAQYAAAIRQLAYKAYRGLDADTSDRIAKECFIRGLKPAIQRFVASSRPESFNEAVMSAQEQESYIQMKCQPADDGFSALASFRNHEPKRVTFGSSAKEDTSTLLLEEIRKLNSKISELSEIKNNAPLRREDRVFEARSEGPRFNHRKDYNNNNKSRSGWMEKNRDRRTRDGRVICHLCNKAGHIARNCFSRSFPNMGTNPEPRRFFSQAVTSSYYPPTNPAPFIQYPAIAPAIYPTETTSVDPLSNDCRFGSSLSPPSQLASAQTALPSNEDFVRVSKELTNMTQKNQLLSERLRVAESKTDVSVKHARMIKISCDENEVDLECQELFTSSVHDSQTVSPVVLGYVNSGPAEMLVDTGSQVTLMKESFWFETPCAEPLIPPGRLSVKSLSGHKLGILGIQRVLIELGPASLKHDVVVVRDSSYDMVIGIDFLKSLTAVIDMKDNVLKIQDYAIPLWVAKDCEPPRCKLVTLKDSTSLLPRSENLVVGYVKADNDQVGIFEASARLFNQHTVCGAKALVTVNDREIPVRLVNLSSQIVQLPQDSRLGVFDPNIEELTTPPELTCAQVISAATPVTQITEEDHSGLQDVNLDDSDITKSQKGVLISLLAEFKDVFSDGTVLGYCDLVKHTINTGTAPPVKQRPYRMPQSQMADVKKQLERMEAQGLISPSASPWCSPLLVVKKSDGSNRLVCDYRILNKHTIPDNYPLPTLEQIFDKLGGAQYFSVFDFAQGYLQIAMDEKDKYKTCFTSYFGNFDWNVMPMGLRSSPSTWQRGVEFLFVGLNHECMAIYLDDILLWSETFQDHLDKMRIIFTRLRYANLKLKTKKCKFLAKEVVYLGHLISKKGMQPNPKLVKAIQEYKIPKSVKEVRQFLGLASYYRRFCKDFATIAKPLHNLLKKGRKFEWGDDSQKAFEVLKRLLTSEPIVIFPNFRHEFHLTCDASLLGLGAVLSQQIDGFDRVVGYASRSLSKSEVKYAATELEMLAVVWGIRYFRPYLYGRHFVVYSDHNSLVSIMKSRDQVGRIGRWVLKLQEYDFVIRYKPGKINVVADGLSRAPLSDVNNVSVAATTTEPQLLPKNPEEYRELQLQDPEWGPLIRYKEVNELPDSEKIAKRVTLRSDSFVLINGVLYHIWSDLNSKRRKTVWTQLCVPEMLKSEVLETLHDDLFGAHFGFEKSYIKIRQRYFWTNLYTDVYNWVKTCVPCATRKNPRHKTVAPLQRFDVPEPFERCAIDCLGPLPSTKNGNNYVIMFTDYATRWPEMFACPDIKAETIAKFLVEEVIIRHGAPQTLLSDLGRNFLAELVLAVCKLFSIRKIWTTAYNPKCNALCERMNRTLLNSLSMYVNSDQKNWDEIIPYVLFAYRTSIQSSAQESPFYLLYGRDPRFPIDTKYPVIIGQQPIVDYTSEMVSKLHTAQKLVKSNLAEAETAQRQQYDKNVFLPSFPVGSKVWLYQPAVPRGKTRKLLHQYHGPYRIVAKPSIVNAIIRPIDGNSASDRRVNVNRLKLCHVGITDLHRDKIQDTPNISDAPITIDKESKPDHVANTNPPPQNGSTPVSSPVELNWTPGELVWAKLPGSPFWPGKIAAPDEIPAALKFPKGQGAYFPVYFYGTHNYSYVPAHQIFDYVDNLEFYGRNKHRGVQKGIKEIDLGLSTEAEPVNVSYVTRDNSRSVRGSYLVREGHGMARYSLFQSLLLFSCFLVVSSAAEDIRDYNSEYIRVNAQYGTLFYYDSVLDNTLESLNHFFAIPIQIEIPDPPHLQSCPKELRSGSKKLFKWMDTLIEQLCRLAEDLNNTVIHTHTEVVKELIDVRSSMFEFMVWEDFDSFEIGPQRSKRGLLTEVSCWIESLLGFCQKSGADADTVRTALGALDERVTGIKSEVIKMEDKLYSLSKLTMNNFKNLDGKINVIENSVQKLVAMQNLLQTMVMNQTEHFAQVGKLAQLQTAILVDAITYVSSMLHYHDQISEAYNIFNSLVQLEKGYLSTNLVPPKTLRQALKHIEEALLGQKVRLLYGSNMLEAYYSTPYVSSIIVNNSVLHIGLSIPLTQDKSQFKLWKIVHSQLPVNSSGAFLSIKPDYQYFGLNQDQSHYILLKTEEYGTCRGDRIKRCLTPFPIMTKGVISCEYALYQYLSHKEVESKCQILISKHKNPVQAYEIASGIWFIATAEGDWRMFCNDKSPISVKSCSQCIIKLPCHCGLSLPSQSIPDRALGCVTKNFTASYSINPFRVSKVLNFNTTALFETPIVMEPMPHIENISRYLDEQMLTHTSLQINYTKFMESIHENKENFIATDEQKHKTVKEQIKNIQNRNSTSMFYVLGLALGEIALLGLILFIWIKQYIPGILSFWPKPKKNRSKHVRFVKRQPRRNRQVTITDEEGYVEVDATSPQVPQTSRLQAHDNPSYANLVQPIKRIKPKKNNSQASVSYFEKLKKMRADPTVTTTQV